MLVGNKTIQSVGQEVQKINDKSDKSGAAIDHIDRYGFYFSVQLSMYLIALGSFLVDK